MFFPSVEVRVVPKPKTEINCSALLDEQKKLLIFYRGNMRCQLTQMDMAKGQPCFLSESNCLVQRGQEDSGTLAKCGWA